MATVGFQESQSSSTDFHLSLGQSTDEGDLSQRIEDFKNQNPEDVEELKRCIQDVLGEAERTAQERLDKKTVSLSDKQENLAANPAIFRSLHLNLLDTSSRFIFPSSLISFFHSRRAMKRRRRT